MLFRVPLLIKLDIQSNKELRTVIIGGHGVEILYVMVV